MTMKKNFYLVKAEGLVENVDFKVVMDTPFHAEQVNHFYEITNHTFNFELLAILGLGVVQNLYFETDYYIYNASDDWAGNRYGFLEEMFRIRVYYQITHPEFNDRELEKLVFQTESGTKYLKLLQTKDSDEVVERLREIYDGKKGRVIPFR